MLQPRPRRARCVLDRCAALRWVVAGELAILLGLFLVYRYARLLIEPTAADAVGNAGDVIAVQQGVGVLGELRVQDVLLTSETATWLANVFYATVHFPVTALFLVWLFVRARSTYFRIRTTLVLMTSMALVLHAAYPLAPPRLLGDRGFVDTAAVYGPSVYHAAPEADSLANQFAAMPSLHFGWAVVVALGMVRIGRSRLRWLWVAHPVVTLLVIVGTGNHYWADAAVAGLLLVVADVAVRRSSAIGRLAQPTSWRRARDRRPALPEMPHADVPGRLRAADGAPTSLVNGGSRGSDLDVEERAQREHLDLGGRAGELLDAR